METDLERGERAPSGVDDVIPNATNDEGHSGTERVLASPTDLVETADRNVSIEESSSTWLPVPDSIVKATTTAVKSVQISSSSSTSEQVHRDNADKDFLDIHGTPPYIPPTAYGFSEPIGSMYFLMALLIFRRSKTVSCWGLG
jgi:hypothetical protein